jgi:glycosyltransferase involved in cell wall biosynthesis
MNATDFDYTNCRRIRVCARSSRIAAVKGPRLNKSVSIIIDNYNYQDYVAAAIESALSQTYQPCEIIVVDDGSTDNSQDVIRSFGDKIKVIFKKNGGQASAFNTGFSASTGDIVCLLDSDDLFLPTKVSRIVEILNNSLRQWCFHHLKWVDKALAPVEMPANRFSTGDYDLRDEMSRGESSLIPPATSGLAFTRDLLGKIMPIPETVRITADNYLKLPAMLLAPGFYTSEQLALQRLHPSNFYTRSKGSTNRANVELSVACGLDSKFPGLRVHCNRMFVSGVALTLLGDKVAPEVASQRNSYFKTRTPAEKLSMATRVAYRVMKGIKSKVAGRN